MAMMADSEARAVLIAAFAQRGIAPNLHATQAVQAIGRFEGNYGYAFGGANNWGAVQCTSPPPCPPTCVELTDTHADGTKYQWCYRRYPTPVDGAADLVRELYRRDGVPEALALGDARLIAERMRAAGYFEAPAERYAKTIAGNAETIARNIGEPLVVAIGGVPMPPPAPGPVIPTTPRDKPTRKGSGAAVLVLAGVGVYGLLKARSSR
jgi:hypothetical protein